MKKKNIGSTFDSWLREERLYERVSATAIKRVVARQVEAAMQQKGVNKVDTAGRARRNRAACASRAERRKPPALRGPPLKKPRAVCRSSSSAGTRLAHLTRSRNGPA